MKYFFQFEANMMFETLLKIATEFGNTKPSKKIMGELACDALELLRESRQKQSA